MHRHCLLSLLTALVAWSVVHAETIIPGGNVTGTWTADGSPFIITADITVQNNDSLLIGPGVRVQFDSNVTLGVLGRLIADGSVQPGVGDTIFFTSNGTPNWGGIFTQNADDTIRFTFCVLEYGEGFSFSSHNDPLVMHDCRLSMPFIGEGDCSMWLKRCLVTGDLYALSWSAHVSPCYIMNCTILGNVNFPDFAYNTHIDSSLITGNFGSTYLGNLWIEETTIQGNLQATHNDDMHLYVTNSAIYGDMPSVGNLEMDHSIVYGSVVAYGIPTDVTNLYISNNSIIHGPICLGTQLTVSITNSALLGHINLDDLNRECTFWQNVICDSVWGQPSPGLGYFPINFTENKFWGGSINLAGYFFYDSHFSATNNWIINSEVNGIQLTDLSGFGSGSIVIGNNTINNCAGHGISIIDANPFATAQVMLANNIVTSNGGYGISVSPMIPTQATYNDIWDNELGNYSGVIPGEGALSVDPTFVDTIWSDCRLDWGSPCIDSGDPGHVLDPDSTQSDRGAFFFDQSHPVRVLLTGHSQPILILEGGGSFDYTIRLTNITSNIQQHQFWVEGLLPDSGNARTLIAPIWLAVPPNTTLSAIRTQSLAAEGPAGLYRAIGRMSTTTDTSEDSFPVIKLGSIGDRALQAVNWWDFGDVFNPENSLSLDTQNTPIMLYPSHPNPFNASTVIRYQIPGAGQVSLKVYDTAGRPVATLVEGWRDAGVHAVTFEGSKLASGVYFLRMQTSDYKAVQKMMLLK
jgi:hypothetical protein